MGVPGSERRQVQLVGAVDRRAEHLGHPVQRVVLVPVLGHEHVGHVQEPRVHPDHRGLGG